VLLIDVAYFETFQLSHSWLTLLGTSEY